MSSPSKPTILFLLFVCVFLVTNRTANACSCAARPTVLDAYDGSDVVMIGRVISVEKVEGTDQQQYVDGVRSATMIVEKVFKGRVKARDELVFGQGGGADCIWTFSEKSVGMEYLFYLDSPEKLSNRSYLPSRDPNLWFAGFCGRSTGLEGATDDLLYLEKMAKVRGKTRISGTIGGWLNPGVNVEGKKIRIIGTKKTYVIKTDRDGVFEIYDLPPGKYLVEPEMPRGWKIDPYWLRYSPSVDDADYYEPTPKSSKQVTIILEPKKHAGVDISFTVDNVVRGKVLGPTGVPMQGVCVYLWARDQEKGFGPSDCTNENGTFEITSVPSGEYVAVANGIGKLSNRQPFKTLYYPNVSEREKAAVIIVAPGDSVDGINIVIPKLEETINVEGVLRYSDGEPVSEEWVKFKAEDAGNDISGDVNEKTDSTGRFSLKILKGLRGDLFAEDWLLQGLYKNCPEVDELIAKSGRNNTTVQSNVHKFKAEQNIYDLELTLPFPRCEKAKE